MTKSRGANRPMALDQVTADVVLNENSSIILSSQFDPSHSSDVKNISKEYFRQREGMRALVRKKVAGDESLEEIGQSGMSRFSRVAEYGTIVTNEAAGKDHAHQVAQFNEAQVERCAHSMLATYTLTTHGIAVIEGMSPFLPKPEKKLGFLERWRGG